MVTHTLNLGSTFISSKCTHTHCGHSVKAEGSHLLQLPGSICGFSALLKGNSVVGIEGGRECSSFTPLTYISFQYWDSNPQPSGYKYNSLTIMSHLHSSSPFLSNKSQWYTLVLRAVDPPPPPYHWANLGLNYKEDSLPLSVGEKIWEAKEISQTVLNIDKNTDKIAHLKRVLF